MQIIIHKIIFNDYFVVKYTFDIFSNILKGTDI